MASSSTTTKSIDVGSMFLMDLSLHESDSTSGDSSGDTVTFENDNSIFPILPNKSLKASASEALSSTSRLDDGRTFGPTKPTVARDQSIADHRNHQHQIDEDHYADYTGSSLERLALAIRRDDRQDRHSSEAKRFHVAPMQASNNLVTIAEPQPLPEQLSSSESSSLSDGSFVASSDSSLSASLMATSGESDLGGRYNFRDDVDEDSGSTATREDSGVLDMKDLDSQVNNSYVDNNYVDDDSQGALKEQEKPISNNIKTAKNLTSNRSANTNYNNNLNSFSTTSAGKNRPTAKATSNNMDISCPKRPMSASLPIKVPARQMKKDINKLKLNLLSENMIESESDIIGQHPKAAIKIGEQQLAVTDDLDDEFLRQEYNENHNNHYGLDEHDDERLRADENPMKLFASIQALARSLHEDTELFGSLPPKRMLESPIRSLALV